MLQPYFQWLHGQWPAGKVEKLPKVGPSGTTSAAGVYIVGDLSGVPLLKMSLESGAEAVRHLHQQKHHRGGTVDLVIIGAGCAGISAAAEAQKLGLNFRLLDSHQAFSTIENFPKGKPIYTYPTEMQPHSEISVSANSKESLLTELKQQVQNLNLQPEQGGVSHLEHSVKALNGGHRVHLEGGEIWEAKHVIIAIGRSGSYRTLDIPGDQLDKVSHRLHDPATFSQHKVCIIGGGDSACEAAISIAEAQGQHRQKHPNEANGNVTLVYRGSSLSRPKQDNVEKVTQMAQAGSLQLKLGSQATAITDNEIQLKTPSGQETLDNDAVLVLIGRRAPLDFFRKSKLPIHGEFSTSGKIWIAIFALAITMLYAMKTLGAFQNSAFSLGRWGGLLEQNFQDPRSFLGSLALQAKDTGFWVTILYSSAVVCFGIDRIKRRQTPYITRQTLCLMAIQCFPLFILPELLLPWADRNQWIPSQIVEELFTGYHYGSDGQIQSYTAYWHAYGFILAWPLMAWIVFSPEPLTWWLIISFVQTFIIIPFIIYRWGKGAYCGWICSCGALAETMGDRHREKMPHGPFWNKLNLLGQGILYFAIGLLICHIAMWTMAGESGWPWLQNIAMKGIWKPFVDFFLAGALGTGLYFAFSGRVWCRFACPLAALMHIFTRFSRFRILVEQKKCISCQACTSVCHQGIDVMNFANKGQHMKDPQCVRCSACVQTCPTGVLQFGQVDQNEEPIRWDQLQASPVIMKEKSNHRPSQK